MSKVNKKALLAFAACVLLGNPAFSAARQNSTASKPSAKPAASTPLFVRVPVGHLKALPPKAAPVYRVAPPVPPRKPAVPAPVRSGTVLQALGYGVSAIGMVASGGGATGPLLVEAGKFKNASDRIAKAEAAVRFGAVGTAAFVGSRVGSTVGAPGKGADIAVKGMDGALKLGNPMGRVVAAPINAYNNYRHSQAMQQLRTPQVKLPPIPPSKPALSASGRKR